MKKLENILVSLNKNLTTLGDKCAIIQDDRSISYRELDYAVEHLKTLLSTQIGSVRPKVIPIMAERSIEFVVAALACWKVGVGYLPISTNTPNERVKFILQDTQSSFVLINSDVNYKLNDIAVLNWQLETSAVSTSAFKTDDKEQLAYVIYTSGTTGIPKGCAVGFETLSPTIAAFSLHFNLDDNSHISVVANTSFDAIVIEIWPGLSVGATLHIVDQAILMHPQLLADFYHKNNITFSWLPTPIAEILMSEESITLPLSLVTIQTAGQRLKVRPPKNWHVRVENSYGPTETTVMATSSLVSSKGSGLPDIGTPLPGVRCHILDKYHKPVSSGKSGELYISGIGVSRGYINRPELNEKKFVHLLSVDTKPVRAYATGDICRLNETNKLEFIDRIDNQIKLNGYRIEIGEIENSLSKCEGVVQSAVLYNNLMNQPCLVGYYTTKNNLEIDQGLLVSKLSSFLPEYMIPAHFVHLEEFPMTANGKEDRASLPVLSALASLDRIVDTSLSDDEQRFLALFNNYTSHSLGWHDDFFAAGGNSISAIRLASAVYQIFSIVMPFEVIFEQRTAEAIWQVLHLNEFSNIIVEPRQQEFTSQAPLSSSQRSIWFLANLDPTDRAYHAKATVSLQGDINPEAVAFSVQQVVDSHEVFRTSFVEKDGEVLQNIYPALQVNLNQYDFSHLSREEAMNNLDELVQDKLNTPFQLDKLPLVRWGLVKLACKEFVLVHIEHHLVHDGWSYNIFLANFIYAYKQFCQGSVEVANCPPQYADFCVKQQSWLQSSAAKEQTDYWRQQMRGAPEQINLPRKNTIDVPSKAGKTIRMKLTRETWQNVERFAEKRGETTFSFILAIYNYVLNQYSGDKDICIGSAFANRNWVNADQIIGMMINTVVLRTPLTDVTSIDDLLRQSFKTVAGAQNNQELPFENVVNAINPTRTSGVNPLFQVFLGFHDSPMPELDLPGLTDWTVKEAIDSNAAKFDLSVVLIPRENQEGEDSPVHVLWEYKQGVYSDWLIEQMMETFVRCVDIFLQEPKARLLSIPSEVKPLEGKISQISTEPVVCRIMKKAEQYPLRTAIKCEQEKLSYQELSLAIQQKAAVLRERGFGNGDIIGVCLPRSIDLLVWMLAVQAVGAAYVPLDPAYPKKRLRYIVEHSQMKNVVCLQALDFPCEQILSSTTTDSPFVIQNIDIKSAMYVIYTSGSTGKPKGVVISHKAFNNFIGAMSEEFPLTEEDTWLAVTSCSFDISTLELYLPLLQGAVICLATTEQAKDPRQLMQLLEHENISYCQATPTTWRSLVENNWVSTRTLQCLCGGEPLDNVLAIELINAGVRLFNLYGPTETTVWSCINEITSDNADQITLGRPISNTQIHLLDERGNPVVKGAIGQLWIGGDSLASGYLFEQELTDQRFMPLKNQVERKIYNTGDLASINEHVELVYHGRSDYQVKLDGYRIELGEIEHVLRQNTQVNDVVVTLQNYGVVEQLVAFVVAPSEAITLLTEHCEKHLPHYMLPSQIVILEQLPLTPNGKIDRNLLPSPSEQPKINKLPSTDTEIALVVLYSELLAMEQVDTETSFFKLGGRSLMAMRLVSMIEVTFSVRLSVSDFISLSTISRVAACIDSINHTCIDEDIVEEFSI